MDKNKPEMIINLNKFLWKFNYLKLEEKNGKNSVMKWKERAIPIKRYSLGKEDFEELNSIKNISKKIFTEHSEMMKRIFSRNFRRRRIKMYTKRNSRKKTMIKTSPPRK